MFNEYDYNDNIEYCRYVYEKNEELDLGLETPAEIQFVANRYLDAVSAKKQFDDDEVYKNDEILQDVCEKALKRINKFKNKPSYVDEDEIDMNLDTDYTDDNEIDIKLAADKKLNQNGGHGYSEAYDDHGLDEKTGIRR